MRRGRWNLEGTAGQRGTSRLDNLALVPASLLPHKAVYQRFANQLPSGAVLVVLPTDDSPERRTLQEAATRLRAKGHPIATMSVDEVLTQSRRGRATRASDAPPAATEATPPLTAAAAEPPAPAERSEPSVTIPAQPPEDTVDSVPPFRQELRLVRIDNSAAPARYEVLCWQRTLWGGVALARLRGTLGRPPTVQVLLEAETPQHSDVVGLVQRRLRSGYRIADWQ